MIYISFLCHRRQYLKIMLFAGIISIYLAISLPYNDDKIVIQKG